MTFSFDLFVDLISPHATKVTRNRGAGASHLRDGHATDTLALRAIPVPICFSDELSRDTDTGRAHYAAFFHQRLHFT